MILSGFSENFKGKHQINNDVSNPETSLPLLTFKGNPQKISIGELERIIQIISKDMMPRLCGSLFIEVEFVKRLYTKEKIYGDLGWTDLDSRYPRDFNMRIDAGLSKKDMIETIAHELTHVKQYARCELKHYFRALNRSRWKGQIYEDIKYEERPWEIEAEQNEKIYYEKFKHLI